MSPDGPRPSGPRLESDPSAGVDDFVAAFQIEAAPVRGRIVRLGDVADDILSAHAYPEPVAVLLGEALMLAVLVGASLKFDGRLIVQASGDGPAPFLVADYHTAGAVRGYARINAEPLANLLTETPRPTAAQLLGRGHFAMTIDRGGDAQRYQSLAPIEGDSLAGVAERYFEQSEQVPTRIRLSTALVHEGGPRPSWRAGGVLLQQVAGDAARGDTDDDWETARTLFDTVGDDELADPALSAGGLLYRLFHEEGVRLLDPKPIVKRCPCSADRVADVMERFPEAELEGLADADGRVRVTCEYCNRDFWFEVG